MNKKTNNKFILMTALLIVVIVLGVSTILGKLNVNESTSDMITGGLVLIIAIALYVGFHLKETKEIQKAKTTNESIAKTFSYYSRNVKYFQKISIIGLILYGIYQIKNMTIPNNFDIESIPFELITTVITSIISITMLGQLGKFFDYSATSGTPFNKENVKILSTISKLFLALVLINHSILSLAIFIFVDVISIVFKLGVELQEENDNTI